MPEIVASFQDPVEAQIVCALLESAGIAAVAADFNLATANWPISLAIGGVKIQVQDADVEEARKLIAAYHAGELSHDEAEEDRCGACGSEDLGIVVPASQKALALTVFAIAGAPISTRTRRVCKRCGAVESES